MRFAAFVCLATAVSIRVFAQPQDPDPELITTDIDHFWEAYDASQPGNRVAALQRLYFDRASPGLREFVRLRGLTATNLAQAVDGFPKYYGSIRDNTQKVANYRSVLRLYMGRFRGFYADAQFPPTYFLIGRLSTGGTVGPESLLIGTELFAAGPGVDLSEVLALNPRFERLGLSLEKLPFIVMHELTHTQLKFDGQQNLLNVTLIEGAADLLSSLTTGRTINEFQASYAEARRDDLFRLFALDVNQSPADLGRWLYNGSQVTADQVPDLGYWIGHEICRDFLARSEDKKAAIAEIVTMSDPMAIVSRSSYAWILDFKPSNDERLRLQRERAAILRRTVVAGEPDGQLEFHRCSRASAHSDHTR